MVGCTHIYMKNHLNPLGFTNSIQEMQGKRQNITRLKQSFIKEKLAAFSGIQTYDVHVLGDTDWATEVTQLAGLNQSRKASQSVFHKYSKCSKYSKISTYWECGKHFEEQLESMVIFYVLQDKSCLERNTSTVLEWRIILLQLQKSSYITVWVLISNVHRFSNFHF